MTDPVQIARVVLADPRRRFTLPADDILTLCQAVVDLAATEQLVITTELAEAVRRLISAEADHTMARGPDGHAPLEEAASREMAFLNFKNLFEQEFPDV
jgi:hypothetical protein